jgi:spermidine/putrescine transport system permease protein
MARRRTPLEYIRSWQMRLWLFLVFFFLYAPLVALIAFSFNNSRLNIVWRGFTLNYYAKLFDDRDLMMAFGNSLTIAFAATLISLVIGTLGAILMWRYRFTGKTVLEGVFTLPLVVPEICMGVAMLLFFTRVLPWPNNLVWPLNLGSLIIAHASFCFPFVLLVVRARLASFNKEQEEAARDLGANDWQAFRDVLVPHMRPALISGGLLAFILSLDDFVITFFTSGPDTVTFPVKVYSMLRFSVTPEVNAASAVLILLTIVLMTLMTVMQRKSKKA